MKLLHCISQFPGMTGSGIYFQQLVARLNHLGFQNALLYAEQEDLEADFLQADQVFPLQFKSQDLPFPIVGMSDEMPYESTVYSQMTEEDFETWIINFRKRLEEAKTLFQPQCVISHHIFILTSIAREVFHDIPVIGISHGTDIRQVKMNPWIKEKYIHHASDLDFVFALSPSDAERLHDIFSIPLDKIHVTGGGFDEDIFKPNFNGNDSGRIQLLFSGKISHAKGVYELAKAFPRILEEKPQAELLILGNARPDQKERIRKYSQESDRVHFHPAVGQKEYGRFLQEADLYILPSYYEGIALSAIEALASRTRVVVTENDNLSWLLGTYVNRSGVIEYISLPRLKNVDTPYEEDLPSFISHLVEACVRQIEQIEEERETKHSAWDSQLIEDIQSHSWSDMVDEIALKVKKLI